LNDLLARVQKKLDAVRRKAQVRGATLYSFRDEVSPKGRLNPKLKID